MMNRTQQAVEDFKQGFSCSQAVLGAFCEPFSLDRETALKISQSFGGGMAHLGEVCGAVSGAFLVLGLKYGRVRVEDTETKEKNYLKVREFVRRFKALNGSINCTQLLGYDLNEPDELRTAQEKNIFETQCSKLVRDAASILEDIL